MGRTTNEQIAKCWGLGLASNHEIDAIGILPATRLAMKCAISKLSISPQHLLIDAVILKDFNSRQTNLIKGDSLILSIAAASVLAKTARVFIYCNLDRKDPFYGFSSHKGYGTPMHRLRLKWARTLPYAPGYLQTHQNTLEWIKGYVPGILIFAFIAPANLRDLGALRRSNISVPLQGDSRPLILFDRSLIHAGDHPFEGSRYRRDGGVRGLPISTQGKSWVG